MTDETKKPKSTRRARTDSVDMQVRAMQAADEKIDPPEHLELPEEAVPFWHDIVATRAIDSWTPNDLINAATLARVYMDIQRYSRLVDKSSRMTKNEAGAIRVNAAHRVLVDLVAQAQSLSRSIQVHARATQGESRDQVKRNKLYQDARRTAGGSMDDLIKRPVH